MSDFVDPYVRKREMVREALPAAGWQELRGAVEKLLDLAPSYPPGHQRDQLDAVGDDGFWSCHAAMVAILAHHLGLETRT